jgi:hypothetical protein
MKKIRLLFLALLLTILLFDFAAAQTGPPDPPGEHGSTTNEPSGGNADLGMGVGLLLSLSGAYAFKKLYARYRQPLE